MWASDIENDVFRNEEYTYRPIGHGFARVRNYVAGHDKPSWLDGKTPISQEAWEAAKGIELDETPPNT